MKNAIFLLLAAVVVFTGCQSSQAAAKHDQKLAKQAPAPQTSRFRTCKGFDGPFQIHASQQCPLSGYAQGSGVPTVIEGKPKAVTPAPRNPKFRTCKGFDGPFQIPVSQKCPLSGYAHSDEPTKMDTKGRSKATQAPPLWTLKFRNCTGIDGTFQVPASQKCPLSGYAHY